MIPPVNISLLLLFYHIDNHYEQTKKNLFQQGSFTMQMVWLMGFEPTLYKELPPQGSASAVPPQPHVHLYCTTSYDLCNLKRQKKHF